VAHLPPASLRLVLVADLVPGEATPVASVTAAIRGGTSLVQLRGKAVGDRDLLVAARELLGLCRRSGVPLVINDRPDLALVSEADGAHVGPEDLPPLAARRVLGHKVLGVSARTLDRLRSAEQARADYVGVGALRSTTTKPDAKVLGLEGMRSLIDATRLPVVAIGGVLPRDVPALKRAGAAGIAVMSGVLASPDPERAARAYAGAWESA
jgi:thiamine-phosphate pyrophosphorylase